MASGKDTKTLPPFINKPAVISARRAERATGSPLPNDQPVPIGDGSIIKPPPSQPKDNGEKKPG